MSCHIYQPIDKSEYATKKKKKKKERMGRYFSYAKKGQGFFLKAFLGGRLVPEFGGFGYFTRVHQTWVPICLPKMFVKKPLTLLSKHPESYPSLMDSGPLQCT